VVDRSTHPALNLARGDLASDNFFPARAGIRQFIRRHALVWNLVAPGQVIQKSPPDLRASRSGRPGRSYATNHFENGHRRHHDRGGCQRRSRSAIESIDWFELLPHLQAR
jgi:hypothetical protein